jgi:hypothetical protein
VIRPDRHRLLCSPVLVDCQLGSDGAQIVAVHLINQGRSALWARHEGIGRGREAVSNCLEQDAGVLI